MQGIPKILQYKTVKPRGFASMYKKYQINPQMSFNNFKTNELVRFIFQSDGFIDPYTSYLEVHVDVSATAGSEAGFVLDGSATSLISEFILSQNNKELERVMEYDQIGNLIKDLKMDEKAIGFRRYQGGLPKRHQIRKVEYNSQKVSSILFPQVTGGGVDVNNAITASYRNYGYRPESNMPSWKFTSIANNPQSLANSFSQDKAINYNDADLYRENVLKSTLALSNSYGISSSLSYPITTNATNTGQPATFPTETNWVDSYNINKVGAAKHVGYPIAYGVGISDNNDSQILHATFPALKIAKGQFVPDFQKQNTTTCVSKLKFFVPILSGVVGVLIPQSEYKLIPGSSLNQALFEFRLNPNAFFTTGYKTDATATQQELSWTVTKMQLNFDLWFYDDAIANSINSALQGEGILISSQSFTLGPQYQVPDTRGLQNNWIINNSVESCNAIFFWVLSNDYQNYTFCRKNFKLSGNITYVQLKVGADYIPQWPIQGHAGNIALNSVLLDDNSEFLVNLNKSLGCQFNAQQYHAIDSLSFAINERPYNITALPNTTTNSEKFETDLQLPFFQETRCRGKAVFCVPLDQNPHDQDVISGLDTTKKRPLELIIKCDQVNYNPRPCTLHILLYHDFVVQYRLNEISTYGAG